MTSPVRPLPKTPLARPLVAPRRAGPNPLRDPLAPNSYAAAIPPRTGPVATPAVANPQDQLRSQMGAAMAARAQGGPGLPPPMQRPGFSTYGTPLRPEMMKAAQAPIANPDDAMRTQMEQQMRQRYEQQQAQRRDPVTGVRGPVDPSELRNAELLRGNGLYGSNPQLQQVAPQPGYMREGFPGQGNAYGRNRLTRYRGR